MYGMDKNPDFDLMKFLSRFGECTVKDDVVILLPKPEFKISFVISEIEKINMFVGRVDINSLGELSLSSLSL